MHFKYTSSSKESKNIESEIDSLDEMVSDDSSDSEQARVRDQKFKEGLFS